MLTAIIVAAGSSRRVGFDKLFETIAGKPVIAHAIGAFENSKSVSDIVVIAREDRRYARIGKQQSHTCQMTKRIFADNISKSCGVM